jgi:hypothetical protein
MLAEPKPITPAIVAHIWVWMFWRLKNLSEGILLYSQLSTALVVGGGANLKFFCTTPVGFGEPTGRAITAHDTEAVIGLHAYESFLEVAL